jgi:Leucine-rich repeat (LRR) protein
MVARVLGFFCITLGSACTGTDCISENGTLLIEDIHLLSCWSDNEISKMVVYGDEVQDFGDHFRRFSGLRSLSFEFTSALNVFPADLDKLTKLTKLTIQGTQITEIPAEISNAPLRILRIEHNANLTQIPNSRTAYCGQSTAN